MQNEKRSELCLHTNRGLGLDSITAYLDDCASEYIQAIAVTDSNTVRAYYDAWTHKEFPAKNGGMHKIKIIYGLQMYLMLKELEIVEIIFLAKNHIGLENIYHLIESSHESDILSLEEIAANREGLVVGCRGSDDLFLHLEEIISVFDFIYVTPNDPVKTVRTALTAGLPVCAVGDVRYRYPSDRPAYEYLVIDEGYSISQHLQKPQTLLNHFAYLGAEMARRIVIDEPNRIANMIEELNPFSQKEEYPVFPDADIELQRICFHAAKEVYGDPLPDFIKKRLTKELNDIINNRFAAMYFIAKNIRQSMEHATIRSSAGNSLAAYLLGITNMNPLPPHYLCRHCGYLQWMAQAQSGFDLPDTPCPKCGNIIHGDGYNLSEIFFTGLSGNSQPDFSLNVPKAKADSAINILEGSAPRFRVVCAGRDSALGLGAAKRRIDSYRTENDGDSYLDSYAERLSNLHYGDRQTIPGKYIFVPHDAVIPLEKKNNVMQTHMNDSVYEHRFFSQSVLPYTKLDILSFLEQKIGISAKDIPLNDPAVYESFSAAPVSEVSEAKTMESICSLKYQEGQLGALCAFLRPKSFSELVHVDGICHSTDIAALASTYRSPRKMLMLFGSVSTAEDIFAYLCENGVGEKTAALIATDVRKGKFRGFDRYSSVVDEALTNLSQWFDDFCKGVRYLFPKAFLIDEIRLFVQLMWFKIYYPQAYLESALEFEGRETIF